MAQASLVRGGIFRRWRVMVLGLLGFAAVTTTTTKTSVTNKSKHLCLSCHVLATQGSLCLQFCCVSHSRARLEKQSPCRTFSSCSTKENSKSAGLVEVLPMLP